MANILKKPWKEQKKRAPISLLSLERRKELSIIKKEESLKRREQIRLIREKKREYCDMIRQKEEEKKTKRKNLMLLKK